MKSKISLVALLNDLVRNKYKLVEEIGKGNFGVVCKAIDIVSKEYGQTLIKTFTAIQEKCTERNYMLMLSFYHEKETIINRIKSLHPNIDNILE